MNSADNKFYLRYIKLIPTTNNQNYPLKNLAFCHTGGEYEPLAANSGEKTKFQWQKSGTYNGSTANECVKTYSHCLFKLVRKFIQTDNVIIFNDINKFMFAVKYEYKDLDKYVIPSSKYSYVFHELDEPDPYNIFGKIYDKSNRKDIETKYTHTYKHEVYTGLYKFDQITGQYKFIPKSFYHQPSQMYYVYVSK